MEYELLSKIFYTDNLDYEKIYNERFNSPLSVKLSVEIKGNQAFYFQNPQIFKLIISIQKADKDVGILADSLPGIGLNQFVRRSLIDEIMLTNKIEGVHSTRREILDVLEDIDKQKKKNRFYGLVKKYQMLTRDKLSLSKCEDIREIYDELVLKEVLDDDAGNFPDGKIFRKGSVSINSPTQKELHRGLFPESEIISAMEKSLHILNDDSIEPLIRIAVFHYLFGYIHPFYEGNGRTSRFISSYLLASEYEYLIGYRISYTIKENVNKYYDAFKICNDEKNKGDITPFILMFLEIINISFNQLRYALQKCSEKYRFYESCIKKLKYGDDSKMYEVYNCLIQAGLFAENGVSVQELLGALQISRATLDNRIKKISESGLLKVNTHRLTKYYSLDIDKLDKFLTQK